MKSTREKSDADVEDVDKGDKTLQEDDKDYYVTVEPAQQMDVVDAELLERFLKLLEETSGDDVSYDDLLSESGDNAHPQNASSGNWLIAS